MIIACHDCGTVHRLRKVPSGAVACCGVCGKVLYRGKRARLEAALALSVAAAILFLVAHLVPFMSLEIEGQTRTATLLTGPIMLAVSGAWPLGLLVFLVAAVIPGLRIFVAITVLASLLDRRDEAGTRRPRPGGKLARLYRVSESLHAWSMMEIFLLGAFVAYVKLGDLASLELGPGLFAFVALIVMLVIAEALIEPQAIWNRFERQADAAALESGPVMSCHVCGQLSVIPEGQQHDASSSGLRCPRCDAGLHARKAESLARTWALIFAAIVLYIPANLLPIMTVIYFGAGAPDTIISGVIELFHAGMWPIAILVLFASITVPVLKLIGLIWLLVSVQFGWTGGARRRTALYRIIEGVGRWSMVDVFMISILVALVDLGAIAEIEANAGALCFAGVVILTMLAAASFDPKLIWDQAGAATPGKAPLRV